LPPDLVAWFRGFAAEWGDSTSILGFVITIVGFVYTGVNAVRSRKAAEQARQAAIAVRDTLVHFDAIGGLSSAIASMQELKTLQRNGVWSVLPDRYSDIRARLNAIRASHAPLTEDQRRTLQAAITALARHERSIDLALLRGATPPNPAKLNNIISGHIDAVQTVLLDIQKTLRADE